MDRNILALSGAVLVATIVLAATVPATPATGTSLARQIGERPSFVVNLHEDGSAQMAATVTFDLDTATGAAAFAKFKHNETAREHLRQTFRARMRAAAANGTNATGREMTVERVSIDLWTAGSGTVGVIVLSAQWTGLAAVGNGSLVVTEPFASGFQPDRPFVLTWPGGYALHSATPEPDSTTRTSATWPADSTLEGFEVRLVESDATPQDGGGSPLPVPGFGLPGGLLAVLVAALIGRHRL